MVSTVSPRWDHAHTKADIGEIHGTNALIVDRRTLRVGAHAFSSKLQMFANRVAPPMVLQSIPPQWVAGQDSFPKDSSVQIKAYQVGEVDHAPCEGRGYHWSVLNKPSSSPSENVHQTGFWVRSSICHRISRLVATFPMSRR